MVKKVVLLQGGFSEEREISLKSSAEIHKALNELGYETIPLDPANFTNYLQLGERILSIKPDIVFIGLHGGVGEEGTLQAFLSLLDIPYTGSNMNASSLCMDKHLSFVLAYSIGIKVPEYLVIDECIPKNWKFVDNLVLPLVVKPNNSGSSVGITILRDPNNLIEAIQEAFQYSTKVIIQKYIEGSELTVSILGKKALPVVEIKVKDGWYDYQNKYTAGKTIYETPADLSNEQTNKIQDMSIKLFKTFGCRAYARIDFRYDGKDFYFLEINTLPGMTSLSLTPMAAKQVGISFPELVEEIIEYSLL
ncbi:MAG: D-alanine--D-alanine ligase [Candidatus Cloacimonetes bacterium]|nr:D-alanine--D-alanine ligase [Candidatus Cloacimonadota bacterium]